MRLLENEQPEEGAAARARAYTAALEGELAGRDVASVLRWAARTFGHRLAVATSFGAEDMVLVDAVAGLKRESGGRQIRLFTLDTGRLPEETHQLLDRVRFHYDLEVEVFFPERAAVEALVKQKGPFSFFESVDARRACCHVRKVEPLGRALAGAEAWVVGLRREQSPTRAHLDVVEVDDQNGLFKISPLATWSEAEVWAYLSEHQVPVHKLHDEGYPSIGCAPCTRAVAGWRRGESSSVDIRAGRWWWESPDHKECGLHADKSSKGEAHAAR